MYCDTSRSPQTSFFKDNNNLFHYGTCSLTLDYPAFGEGTPPTWNIYDNLFENGSLTVVSSSSPSFTMSHNGYVNVTVPGASSGGDKTPSAADYQAGPLGGYYYPTTGGNLSLLINAGNATASSLGLYHYTVTTNEVVDEELEHGVDRLSLYWPGCERETAGHDGGRDSRLSEGPERERGL